MPSQATDETASPCVLCGSNRQTILYRKARDRDQVHNVVCDDCGMVFISPRPTPEELSLIYSSGQFSREARGSETPDPAKIAQSEEAAALRFSRIKPFLDSKPATSGPMVTALEIGCGIGSFLGLLAEAGWKVKGLEPDEGYASFGRDKYNIDIEPVMFEEYQAQPESQNLISMFHVLEHILNPREFLDKTVRLLKPSGCLFVEVPCIDKPYGGNLDFFFWSVHVNTFSVNTLKHLFSMAGLEDVRYGFANDFLWMAGSRSEKLDYPKRFDSEGHAHPLDDPKEVYQRTHALHREYLKRSAIESNRSLAFAKRVAHKLFSHPTDVIPAIIRRFKRRAPKS